MPLTSSLALDFGKASRLSTLHALSGFLASNDTCASRERQTLQIDRRAPIHNNSGCLLIRGNAPFMANCRPAPRKETSDLWSPSLPLSLDAPAVDKGGDKGGDAAKFVDTRGGGHDSMQHAF
jgi:hypothetical protein